MATNYIGSGTFTANTVITQSLGVVLSTNGGVGLSTSTACDGFAITDAASRNVVFGVTPAGPVGVPWAAAWGADWPEPPDAMELATAARPLGGGAGLGAGACVPPGDEVPVFVGTTLSVSRRMSFTFSTNVSQNLLLEEFRKVVDEVFPPAPPAAAPPPELPPELIA